jgi:hypothetical protein
MVLVDVSAQPSRGQYVPPSTSSSTTAGLSSAISLGVTHREGTPRDLLQCKVLSENIDIRLLGQKEEIALLSKVDGGVKAFVETLPILKAFLGQADVGLGRKLKSDSSGGVGGRATADSVTLQHDDISHAPGGEMIGDGAAHDPSADDDDLGGCWKDG